MATDKMLLHGLIWPSPHISKVQYAPHSFFSAGCGGRKKKKAEWEEIVTVCCYRTDHTRHSNGTLANWFKEARGKIQPCQLFCQCSLQARWKWGKHLTDATLEHSARGLKRSSTWRGKPERQEETANGNVRGTILYISHIYYVCSP